MKRRFRMAGTALGAIFVPACMTLPPAGGRAPDAPTIPPPPVGVGYRPMPGALAQGPKKPREQFAAGRAVPTETLTAQPTAATAPANIAAAAEVAPMPRPVEPSPLVTAEPTPVPTAAPTELIPTAPEPPRLPIPVLGSPIPVAEPATDAEGVIRPPRPVIPGAPPVTVAPAPVTEAPAPQLPPPPPPTVEPTAKAGDVPALLIPPAVGPAPTAPIPPATGPVLGSSVHETKASPISPPTAELPAEPPQPPPQPTPPTAPPVARAAADSPLLLAVRAFQANRPHEAVEHLKAYDPMTQQVLLSLMPAMVRLTEGKIQHMKPEEMDAVLEQLGKASPILRPRASLQATNVRLCREVHTFAHVEGYAPTHVFRPGDVVHLYMELANFTSVPDGRGGYTIELSSNLELRDGADAVAWRADPKDVPDRVSTPPQDYYRAFRLTVPNVPPGAYKLVVKTTDRPTGREVRKTVAMRVGSR
jgi:hypothetical protein